MSINKTKISNLECVCIAVGLSLSTATQLKSAGPIGIGEIILASWIFFTVAKFAFFKVKFQIRASTRVFFYFWVLSFACLSIGSMIAEWHDLVSSTYIHDLIAFFLAFTFLMLFSVIFASYQDVSRVLSYFISFTIVSLLIIFFYPSAVPFIKPWYFGERFLGWTMNPNQLGLLFSMIPFFSFYLFCHSKGLSRAWYFFLLVGSLIIGIGSDSDAMIIGWVVGSLVFLALATYRLFLNFHDGLSFLYTHTHKILSRRFIILSVFLLFVAMLLLAEDAVGSFFAKVYGSLNSKGGQGQGDDRILLWTNGITALQRSPIFGLGPGAHSGQAGPFLDFEAHNTFIDWADSAGIVGLLLYLLLLGWMIWNAWCNQSLVFIGAIFSVIVFSIFHFILRPIVFWFYLLSIVQLSISSTEMASRSHSNMQKNTV